MEIIYILVTMMEGIMQKCKNNAYRFLEVYEFFLPFLDNTAKSSGAGLTNQNWLLLLHIIR